MLAHHRSGDPTIATVRTMKTVWPAVLTMMVSGAAQLVAAQPVGAMSATRIMPMPAVAVPAIVLPGTVLNVDTACGTGRYLDASGTCRSTVRPVPPVPRWQKPREPGELPQPPAYRPPTLPERKTPPKRGQFRQW